MAKNKYFNIILIELGILSLFVLITYSVFFHRFEYITEAYGLGNVDTDGTLWYYWAQNIYDQRKIIFEQIDLIGYPFGYNVSYIPFSNLIYSGIIYLINIFGNDITTIVTLSNLSSLIVYPLQAFFTYLLVYYLTKNRFAGFSAGIISSFSYFFILMNRGSLSLNHIYWIPLTLLFVYRAVRGKHIGDIILAGISFAILFAVNAYWGFFTAIFIVIIVLSETWLRQKETINQKVIFLIKYGLATFISTIIINFNFFLQYFNTSKEFNETRIIKPDNELLSLINYFNPSDKHFLYSFGTGSDFFLGYIALALGISGMILLRKQKYYNSYILALVNFLIAMLLSARIPGLTFINNIYFDYFGIFRAVSRLNVLATLFLAIMVGYVIKYITEYYISRKINIYFIGLIIAIISTGIIFEGLNKDSTGQELTFIKPLEEIYQPIRDNTEIKVIAQYPMALADEDKGFLSNYQLIGQIIHQKTLVSGADPFNQEAIAYYDTIKDIEAPETIDILRKNEVDTIIINKKFFANGDDIVKNLKKDTRLTYVDKYEGDFSQYVNKGNTISYYNEVSAYIEVFRINP